MVVQIEGEVNWFNNGTGYGFIHPVMDGDVVDESIEYFVHFSSIQCDGFKTLQTSQRVLFSLRETSKGIQAVDVSVIK